ncbi:MAG TPA: isoprenylcysteine carboxylmethyltransferase family protein [Lentibacillus sp.]|uniref:isoprenylcysteine carboxyl methyltransferase family protein n=1 Tax=Lentibacillus sp. TaxID=1925746 RepID=UPI002B4AED12|nr:isoprenylcysteine carboxylmethyltransferase family protein [Lentibacillus sp.]HLR63124.1 isoprenylcysteine carboxylmethyltransferase family protein [Lentibacillus sp.]
MTTWMWFFILAVIIQRLTELSIAKSNEKWMKSMGGIEKGEKHYKWFIILHCCFFIAIMTETSLNKHVLADINYFLLLMFLAAQAGRIWCIQTLGKFWNTKVIVLPGVIVIKKGPYKYVKHPNYIIVAVELFVIPMLVGAQLTAVLFPFLHLLLLRIRIPREEKALTKAT